MSLLEDNVDAAVATLEGLRGLRDAVDAAAELLVRTLTGGGLVVTGGNGGSAADAMHLATELVCRFERQRRGYPALCMNASGGDLTAIANDFAYERVFARQVEAFCGPGDLVVLLSTSGTSPNVRLALEEAKARGAASLTLLGRDGGAAAGLATVELCVPGTSTARIQEAHKVLIHTLCGLVEARVG